MKNVHLITADSVRADAVGFPHAHVETTPYLSDLARESLVFSDAIAPGPRTPSSIPVLLTGTHLPVPDRVPTEWTERLSVVEAHVRNEETFAELLSSSGYTTIGVSANPWVSERTGFDEVFDIFHSTNVRGTLATLTSDTRLERVGGYAEEWLHKYGPFSQWPTFYDEIVSLVERADDPYFLWIFLMDTHNPYIPYRPHRVESSAFGVYHGLITANHLIGHDEGSSYRETIGERAERNLRQAYRDCIRSVDRFVERVHRELAGDGDVLVFHADHGEAFGEHGTWGHLPVLYEENVSVPLLVHGLETTGVLSEQVSLIDFPSLLLDAGTCTSVDSVGVISERAVIAVADGSTVAVRDPPWKYVEGEGEALYDVTASEGENLAEGEQPRTARYRKHVEAHRKRVGVRPTNQHITDAPPPTQQLEALGYVDEDGD